MNPSARYQSLVTAGFDHQQATELTATCPSWRLLARILTDSLAA